MVSTDPLSRRAASDPAAPALIDGAGGEVMRWADLDDRAAILAGRLAAVGATPGDRIAVVEAAGPDLAATLHACARLGAVMVPLSPRLPAPELLTHVTDAGAGIVLTSSAGATAVRQVAERIGSGRTRAWSFDGSLDPIAGVRADPLSPVPLDDDREVAIVYTSGTMGRPKGVRLTLANCIASAQGCAEALGGISSDDRWLLALGPHRVGGLAILWRSALFGAPVVYLSRFSEDAVHAALARQPTLASFVPTMLHRLLEDERGDQLAALRALLVGGSATTRGEVRAWAARGLRVCPSYGMTETASQIAVVPPERALELAGTAGLVHSRATIDVDDSEGRPGRLLVGGPVLSPGYVDAELTSRAFAGAGPRRRLRTDDLGWVDGGVVHVVGRVDRMIITGGEKVSPEEVEDVLREHPDVRDVAVFGVPDARHGHTLAALVVSDAGAAALERWCRERLASYRVPRRFEFTDHIARSEDGKAVQAHRNSV